MDIILATLNARYIHASFGLRYLKANLGELESHAALMEFDISQKPTDIVEQLLAGQPRIVGLGVYIWNAAQSLQVVAELKRVRPAVTVIVGGPEVSHEVDRQEICRVADYVITGEADHAFADLCGQLLAGQRPLMRVIAADLPAFNPAADGRRIRLPYHLYDERDIAHRMIYIEASRGCPFSCEFCLSSLDVPVRQAPLDEFLAAMGTLLERGVTHFKFVDRTFNLNLAVGRSILQFFLQRYRPGLFLHFEMIPDRLPAGLRELIVQFPPGALQFEVGIQTFNDETAKLISRRQDNARLAENLRFLRQETGVHVHADLIAGLPGEDMESFGRGFERLLEMGPQEIQVGILKRLRGTPIVRHDEAWEMVYSPHPPYEVLQTKLMDFATMQRMRRFSRFWDLIANSGNFPRTLRLLLGSSPFANFLRLSDWLHERLGKNHGIALPRLAELLFSYLTGELAQPGEEIARAIWSDYSRAGRSDRPAFLRGHLTDEEMRPQRNGSGGSPSGEDSRGGSLEPAPAASHGRRQARHLDSAAASIDKSRTQSIGTE